MIGSHIYMQQAIEKAWQYQLRTYPNPAVGCLILCNSEIIALEAHQKAGTSHAEVLALLKAYETLSKCEITFDKFDSDKAHAFLYGLPSGFFADCILFVTLEPCSHIGKTPSCASLVSDIKPKKVVIASLDPIEGHDGGVKRLQEQGIEVEVGVCKEEAVELLEPFLIWQKRAFVLFKIAQTSNGKIGGGYLSCRESLTHVHQLRSVCSQMVMGGNTIRVDRPTLDCRFTGDNAPDIIIYSKDDGLDREIPLFSVPNREVTITDSLDFWDSPSFILIEGGGGMLSALHDKIDWLLQYQTPKLSENTFGYEVAMELKFLFHDKRGVDLLLWNRVVTNCRNERIDNEMLEEEEHAEYRQEQKSLQELLNSLEIVAEEYPLLWEIESKMVLTQVIMDAFILPKDGYILPTNFGLESKEANEAVAKALSNYIKRMSSYKLETPERRWEAFQDLDVDSVKDNDVEDFFDWIEDLDDFR